METLDLWWIGTSGGVRLPGGPCVCSSHKKPLFLLVDVDIQHTQCPRWFFILERYKSVVTKPRHRQLRCTRTAIMALCSTYIHAPATPVHWKERNIKDKKTRLIIYQYSSRYPGSVRRAEVREGSGRCGLRVPIGSKVRGVQTKICTPGVQLGLRQGPRVLPSPGLYFVLWSKMY